MSASSSWAVGAAVLIALMSANAHGQSGGGASALPNRQEGDYIVKNYRFRDGSTLPEVRLHFTTVGTPVRDSRWKIQNGMLVLHGSSGDASQVLAASFTGPLVAPGQALDPAKHFLIFPDILGAGKSTKPSDGLRARFPKYGYEDLVDLEHRLVTEHFGIERLRLVMGISMGGMHTWMWGVRYPAMTLSVSSLVKVDGRNCWRRIWWNAIRRTQSERRQYGSASRLPEYHADNDMPAKSGQTRRAPQL